MNGVVNFIFESGISLSLLALIYLVLLRKETFFRMNRFFLLVSVFFSIVLPFLRLPVYAPQPVMLSEITVTPYQNLLESVTIYGQGFSGVVENAVTSSQLLVGGYLLGTTVFLLLFVIRILRVVWLIGRSEVFPMDGYRLVVLREAASPFSFLRYVFVQKDFRQVPGYERMIRHELEHVRQGHSLDVLLLELLLVFQWFNPFIWMLKRAICENHEFLADRAVLSSGIRPGEYKELLLTQFVGRQLFIANHFNYSLIKKRIKMMSKIKSPKIAGVKYFPGVLIALALVIAFACEQKKSEIIAETSPREVKILFRGDTLRVVGSPEDLLKVDKLLSSEYLSISTDSLTAGVLQISEKARETSLVPGEEVYFIVEQMPEFPGGELALRKTIAQLIKYPVTAQENGIQGKVYVTFVVAKDGSVMNAKIARGVDPSLDSEALRVVNNLPRWAPGKQKGEAVAVSYTVPINFVLQ